MKQKCYIALLLFLWAAAAANIAYAQDMLTGKELIDALRTGGYNIYFRHAATDWTRDDHVSTKGDWTSCDPEKMRQLTAQGRDTARQIGEAIKRLGIPVGRVYSSQYCRARETARYMGLGPVALIHSIMNMRAAEFVGGRQAVVERARRVLSTPPQAGTNNIFVAHGNLMQATLSVYTKEAGAAIILPQREGELHVVAQLDPEQWEALAK
jgi:phosphohistidine phosphatase SixA